MGLALCLSFFAIACAAGMSLGAWVTSVWLGWGDPKFGGPEGNLRVMQQVLPIVVAVASLSAFFGARKFQDWLNGHRRLAITAGSAAGALTVAAVFASAAMLEALRFLPETPATVLLIGLRFFILAVPAIVVRFSIEVVRRRWVIDDAVQP